MNEHMLTNERLAQMSAENAALRARLAAVKAERDKLRAALKPFAECAAFFDCLPVRVSTSRTLYTFSNTMLISQINPKDRLTVQHFLDARAALDGAGG